MNLDFRSSLVSQMKIDRYTQDEQIMSEQLNTMDQTKIQNSFSMLRDA
jgi:hypothetical protein